MQIRVLRAEEIRRLLPMGECIGLMERTMIEVSAGRTLAPLRTIMAIPGERGMLGNMQGYLPEPECFGVKLVSLMRADRAPVHSSHMGLVLLFEPEQGRPVAILDAGEITAIRTAAASALATRCLARAGAGDLALLGAGEQARSHLEAIRCVRALRRVRVWARNAAKARSFADAEGARHGITIEVSGSVEAAVAGADIVCTLTKAREPILAGAWLAPGAHVNVVGSSVAAAAEIDTDAVVRGRLFVDYRQSTAREAGEYLRALSEGAISPEHIQAEIGEVAAGTARGRGSEREITLYKSLGIAPQDLAAAHYAVERAAAAGVGQVIEF
jgi:ornithine cyclodeaminase/alanine dehydrogenase-like protein (mu-crystallin family)